MEDKRNILREQQPFAFREIKEDKVQISFRGKTIKTLHGKEYCKFQRVLDLEDSYQLQLFMAKVTGHFKH